MLGHRFPAIYLRQYTEQNSPPLMEGLGQRLFGVSGMG